MSLENAFGAALRLLREQSKLSQEELAGLCGIHRTYVSQLERGLKSPTLRLVWRICESLQTDPLVLLNDTASRLHRGQP